MKIQRLLGVLLTFVLLACGLMLVQAQTAFCTDCVWRGTWLVTTKNNAQLEVSVLFVATEVSGQKASYQIQAKVVQTKAPSFTNCQDTPQASTPWKVNGGANVEKNLFTLSAWVETTWSCKSTTGRQLTNLNDQGILNLSKISIVNNQIRGQETNSSWDFKLLSAADSAKALQDRSRLEQAFCQTCAWRGTWLVRTARSVDLEISGVLIPTIVNGDSGLTEFLADVVIKELKVNPYNADTCSDTPKVVTPWAFEPNTNHAMIDPKKSTITIFFAVNQELTCTDVTTKTIKKTSDSAQIYLTRPIAFSDTRVQIVDRRSSWDFSLVSKEESADLIARLRQPLMESNKARLEAAAKAKADAAAQAAAQATAQARVITVPALENFCRDCIWRAEKENSDGVFQIITSAPKLENNVLTYKIKSSFRSSKPWRFNPLKTGGFIRIEELDEPLMVAVQEQPEVNKTLNIPFETDEVGELKLDFNKMQYSFFLTGLSSTWGINLRIPDNVSSASFNPTTLQNQNNSLVQTGWTWRLEKPSQASAASAKPCVDCIFKGRMTTISFRGAKLSANITLVPSATDPTKYLARGQVEINAAVKAERNCKINNPTYFVDTLSDVRVLPDKQYFGFIRATGTGVQVCRGTREGWEDDAFFMWTLNRQTPLKNPVLINNQMRGSNLVEARVGDQKLDWNLSLERVSSAEITRLRNFNASQLCITCAWRGTGKGSTSFGFPTKDNVLGFEASISFQPVFNNRRIVVYEATGSIKVNIKKAVINILFTECTTTALQQTVPFKNVVTINRRTLTFNSAISVRIPIQLNCKNPQFNQQGQINSVTFGGENLPLSENGTRIKDTLLQIVQFPTDEPILSTWDIRMVR